MLCNSYYYFIFNTEAMRLNPDAEFSHNREGITSAPPAGRASSVLTKAHRVRLTLANRVALCFSTIAVWRDLTEVSLAEREGPFRRKTLDLGDRPEQTPPLLPDTVTA